MRILFVYPSQNTELRIPLAISILIAHLRKAGHEVQLFDTTFYGEFHTDNEKMAKLGTHQSTNLNELVGVTQQTDVKKDLLGNIKNFKPDLICASLVERNFSTAKELLEDVEVPVLVGGIMPTIAPDFCVDQDWVDYICVGEGEDTLVDFLNEMNPLTKNIWTKEIANPLRPLMDMDDVAEQDWSDFDERHLLKPFMGKVYKGGAFEFSRGCFKSCSFCVAPKLREIQKGLGCYHRTKTPIVAINEIERKIKEYNLNMISFGDTDFLSGVPKNRMKEFLNLYSDRIKIPFTMQCSVTTLLNEEILSLLHLAQCCAISVGVESGSAKIQKSVIKKVIPVELIRKAFDLCRKHELRVTANYMVGLPYEDENDVRQTIELNRLVNPPSIAVTFFTPFMGTPLYETCIREGWYKPFEERENVYEHPPINMPNFPPEKIKEYVRKFTDDFKEYQEDFSIL